MTRRRTQNRSASYKIDTIDYRGKRVVFATEKWRFKSSVHPILLKPSFLQRVKMAIEDPDEVWQDFSDPIKKRCYYKKYSVNSYVKVVVWTHDNPCKVVTAYELNWIKEVKYPKLKKLL